MDDLLRNQQDMNWVERRARCTLDAVYQCLVNRFKGDIEKINELRKSQASAIRFGDVTTEGGMLCGVLRGDVINGDRTVRLSRHVTPDRLTVVCELVGHANREFTIEPRWNEDTATCDLVVDKEPWPVWRISQRALSHLFFQ